MLGKQTLPDIVDGQDLSDGLSHKASVEPSRGLGRLWGGRVLLLHHGGEGGVEWSTGEAWEPVGKPEVWREVSHMVGEPGEGGLRRVDGVVCLRGL